MRRTGFITHPDSDLHDWPGHPENTERTSAIKRHFDRTVLAGKLTPVTARQATVEEVNLVHEVAYIESVKSRIGQGIGFLDLDTYVTPDSFKAALTSYGGALTAIDRIFAGEMDRAFCCLRPPGHHAGADYSKGFCIFNNIGGAARYAQRRHDIKRVSIFDFDGHHGNGTQDIFYDDATVHYTSLHQYPFYPGTGSAGETGRGAGQGFNLNLPLPAGCDGKQAIKLVEEVYQPAMKSFQPEMILISAGFDAHRSDPLVMLAFESEDYYNLTRILSSVADGYAEGRMVSLLEGGYDLDALTRSAEEHVKGLLENE
jgi:acetoin utilization deacetylase AcuC-like enzyme